MHTGNLKLVNSLPLAVSGIRVRVHWQRRQRPEPRLGVRCGTALCKQGPDSRVQVGSHWHANGPPGSDLGRVTVPTSIEQT